MSDKRKRVYVADPQPPHEGDWQQRVMTWCWGLLGAAITAPLLLYFRELLDRSSAPGLGEFIVLFVVGVPAAYCFERAARAFKAS